jgi:hypothetical protein
MAAIRLRMSVEELDYDREMLLSSTKLEEFIPHYSLPLL